MQLPNFNSLSAVSLLAAVMSLGYSTIAIGGSISSGKQPNTTYNVDGHSTADGVLSCFNAFGYVEWICRLASLGG